MIFPARPWHTRGGVNGAGKMTRIDATFARLKADGKKAFVAYIMAGDPDQATSLAVLELKVLVLLAVFVYAFFRFSWSMRQYTFVALVIGCMPSPEEFASGKANREQFAARAAAMRSALGGCEVR